jgi:hypothetical protein
VLLGVCVFGGRMIGGSGAGVTGAKIFIVIWFVAAAINMWIGVSRAGYSIVEELPIFLVIFAIPTAVAAFVWWKFG